MIGFQKAPGDRIIELGGGNNPDPISDVRVDIRTCYDPQGNLLTHFTADFEQLPLPIKDDDFDGLICKYCLEHLSFTKTIPFIKDCLRILKPNGKVVFITANTERQMLWIKQHPNGWDGKDAFTSMSEVLFGSQDYDANTHRAFFSPTIMAELFQKAGFEQIRVQPFGDRQTDLLIEAVKPIHVSMTESQLVEEARKWDSGEKKPTDPGWVDVQPKDRMAEIVLGVNQEIRAELEKEQMGGPRSISEFERVKEEEPKQIESENPILKVPREELFGKDYFNGGQKWGGYAFGPSGAYQDFPVHWITYQHVMNRKPSSVLEIGAGRGYIVKRLQDAGVTARGLEISKHCYMTRVCDGVKIHDLCKTPWPSMLETGDKLGSWDICFSIAALEHVPEQYLPVVIKEMARTCERGLHGIDFGGNDDGFDKTHVCLHDKSWWVKMFRQHAPGWPVEIVDKQTLEQGTFPPTVAQGDGECKIEVGSFTVQNHFGWINLDIHDLGQFAQQNGYRFQQCDVRQGLPFKTSEVYLAHSSHFLEHLDRNAGLSFLRELRRVIRPDGVIRLAVPDSKLLAEKYLEGTLGEYDDINDGCEESLSQSGKLWELLFSGHSMAYDVDSLCFAFREAGFIPQVAKFRKTSLGKSGEQILRESLDTLSCLSLFVEATPLLD